jgi:hypothetical protein
MRWPTFAKNHLIILLLLLSKSAFSQSVFSRDVATFVKSDKSSIHDKMTALGYTLNAAQENKPNQGYNKLVYYKKLKSQSRDASLYYQLNYDSYSFVFTNGNDTYPKIVTCASPNSIKLAQLKQSFKTSYPSAKLSSALENQCLELSSSPMRVLSKMCTVKFIDCSYLAPDNSGKKVKTYDCEIFIED